MAVFKQRERRKFVRLPCDIEAEYIPLHGTHSVPCSSAGRNISLGGVCLITFEQLRRDQVIELKMTLPGLVRAVVVKAKVAWSAPMGIRGARSDKAFDTGIQFVGISDEDKDILDRFIVSSAGG